MHGSATISCRVRLQLSGTPSELRVSRSNERSIKTCRYSSACTLRS